MRDFEARLRVASRGYGAASFAWLAEPKLIQARLRASRFGAAPSLACQ